jgi:hypothetical protein
VGLLKDSDQILLDKFRSSPECQALYTHTSNITQFRDLAKMKSLGLIKITSENGKDFIALDYGILEKLEYKV